MKIKVTETDIEEGFGSRNCYACVVARALQRTLLQPWAVQYDHAWCRYSKDHVAEYHWPPDMYKIIESMDHGQRPKPFEFDIPDDIIDISWKPLAGIFDEKMIA